MDRGMTADQVLAALWRRKTLVGIVALAVFAVGAAIVMALPDVYTASAVVRVQPQRPDVEMVRTTVSDRVEERLLTVRQGLLARPVLEAAINEFGLYPETVEEHGVAAAVERMRKDIDVLVEGESVFELTYSASDPEVAAQVANLLPELYAAQAVESRSAQAALASSLFAEQVKEAGERVSEWERRIAQFKVDHNGELPEQLEMNMRSLERTGARLTMKSEELRAAEARRSELARARHAADSEAGRLQAAESTLTRELVAAKVAWTGDHPEVQRLERELAAVEARRKEAEAAMTAERRERAIAAAQVKAIREEMGRLEQQMQMYQERIDATPAWTHELAVMNRDYESARDKYQSVLSRKVEAEIAEELETRGAPELFKVVSTAAAPVAPSSPDRMGGLFITMLVALALGVMAGILADLRDESIRDGDELKSQLPMPVLAVVPEMNGKAERRVLVPQRNTVSAPADTLN